VSSREVEFMSWDVFDKNRQTIARCVTKILAAKGDARRNFQFRTVYERKKPGEPGELLAEVFRTALGPVVVMVDAEHGSEAEHVAGTGRDTAPLTGDPRQRFLMKARSRSYVVTAEHLLRRFYPDDMLAIK
jgi:hypothetical protein